MTRIFQKVLQKYYLNQPLTNAEESYLILALEWEKQDRTSSDHTTLDVEAFYLTEIYY